MKKKINKFDISLIFVIIIVNCFLIYYNSKNISYSENNEALIYSDNKLIGRYILKKDYENEFTVRTEKGYNTIVIKNNNIWIKDTDCPDKYCQQQGKISGSGQVIVCLPNRLLIKIVGNLKDNEIDFIAH